MFGGVCSIQAKRYSKAVGIESVRALAGVKKDRHATKGILVTTSWVGSESRDFAARHGRIRDHVRKSGAVIKPLYSYR